MKINNNCQGVASLHIPPDLFRELYTKPIAEFIEKRQGGGGFTASYLSWSHATRLLNEAMPEVAVAYETDDQGGIMFPCGSTAYIRPYLTNGETRTPSIVFPIMDNRFKAIENPDARDLSDACQRGAVKAIATFTGLGLNLYTGEDIPNGNGKTFVADTPAKREAVKVVASAPRVSQTAPEPPKQGEEWRDVVLHFGKNKDKRLGDLMSRQLSWYQNEWQPDPERAGAEDHALRSALDISMGKVAKVEEPTTPLDEIAEQSAGDPTDPDLDEEVPF